MGGCPFTEAPLTVTFTQSWRSEGAWGESEGPVWLKRGVEVRGQGLNSLR